MILRAPYAMPGRELSMKPRMQVTEHGLGFFAALLALALIAEVLVLRPIVSAPDVPVAGIDVVFGLVGGSFAISGLVAWRRRPDSLTGVLMTATGFAFFIAPLMRQLDGAVAFTTWNLLVDTWIFFYVPVLLTLLTRGRMRDRRDRWLVAAYALPLVLLQMIWMLFAESEEGENLLLAFPDEDVAHVIDRTQRGLLVCTLAITVTVIAVRWWRAPAPRRRALLPSVAGAFTLLMFMALLVNDLVSGTRSEVLLWATACSLVTVPLAFLAGQLRSRLARGALADLFRNIGGARPDELRPALARALGDPDLAVAYWQPGTRTYADADGRDIRVHVAGERSVAHVERDGRPLAALVYDASLDDDPELVEAVTSAAAIAIENQRLLAESEVQVAEIKASRERIVAASDAERRRLERNLHDGAQQRLVGIALQLRLLQNRVADEPSATALVSTASDELAHSLSELRELARGLHPAVLEHGLGAALDSVATRSPVPTGVDCELPGRLPQPVELAAYFVVCEALANVAKYAHARTAAVRVRCEDGFLRVEVADDGVGGADATLGSGLRGLADRVEALDGRLLVSSPAGAGTTVRAELPCGS
ncbi:MAG TPA: histidine kinase [Solirubrobacteraceae bacterium]|nr:histidine kinase [Solirubrobacteraceae bacterium]